MKKNIPDFITCLNLLCGCLAIVFVFENNMVVSSYLIFAAAVFDFMDGMAARLLKAHSPIGKDLDSLADVVTFGVVPGMIVYKLLGSSLPTGSSAWVPYIAFLIPVFSALRLAKFNIDTRQTSSFIGLPTPACTMVFASFPLILLSKGLLEPLILNPYFLIGLTSLMSYLLVAELPLFALKFKNLSWDDNKVRYIFIVLSIALIAILRFSSIPFIILLYILLSLASPWLSPTSPWPTPKKRESHDSKKRENIAPREWERKFPGERGSQESKRRESPDAKGRENKYPKEREKKPTETRDQGNLKRRVRKSPEGGM